MTPHRLGCIADDYTGASDLASMLVRAGLRVVQCFGIPDESHLGELDDADAIVVSLKSRSVLSADAVNQSLNALGFLQSQGATRFFFKYCSTFDSTPQGNIGQVADALAEQLDVDNVMFCPAFPENGRTVHCGHLFVNRELLSESGMRNHPLNPMTDSNLVRVLQTQTRRNVDWFSARAGFTPAKASHWIADAIDDEDLRAVANLAQDHALLTGGSAIARYWSEAIPIRSSGPWSDSASALTGTVRSVVLAGSCSDATRQQVSQFERIHPALHLSIEHATDADELAANALGWCESQWDQTQQPLLISSSADPVSVAAARRSLGEKEAAALTESAFAKIAIGLQTQNVERLVVAGGETSGAVINALGVDAVRIGPEISPGVPWITSIRQPSLSLALKSGNFGGPQFFLDALDMKL